MSSFKTSHFCPINFQTVLFDFLHINMKPAENRSGHENITILWDEVGIVSQRRGQLWVTFRDRHAVHW